MPPKARPRAISLLAGHQSSNADSGVTTGTLGITASSRSSTEATSAEV